MTDFLSNPQSTTSYEIESSSAHERVDDHPLARIYPFAYARGHERTALKVSSRFRCLTGLLMFVGSLVVHAGELRWNSSATGGEMSLTLHEPVGKSGGPSPVVFYCVNLASPRIGTESDASIISDFRADGFLVVTLDYQRNPQARVPGINRDFFRLRDDVMHKRLLGDRKIDGAHVYIVPSGSRLKRDVIFFRDEKRTLAMDVIYPVRPAHPVGTVLEFSCDNRDRMGNGSLAICSDTILDASAGEGFAVAMADHPVAAPYKGLDAMPASAWKIKAAVRTLRAQSAELGLNGRIVPVGFSRGSGMALMLVTTAGLGEFEGHGENPQVSSGVDGAVVMSGRFTYLDLLPTDTMQSLYAKAWGERATHEETWKRHGALDYLQAKPDVPLFLTINCSEGPDALHQMEVLRKRLAALGADQTFLMDQNPRGHKVTLDPRILTEMNRYFRARLSSE